MGMDRRTALGLIGTAALINPSLADTVVAGDGVLPSDPKDVIALWPGTPPGGRGVRLPPIRVTNHEPPYITPSDRAIDQVGVPLMNVFRPERPDGSALILAPGGGSAREMLDFEGMDVARHFNAAGITCFVLRYRLPAEGWQNRSDVPLQDAQRAMRVIRARAAEYGIDPNKVSALGFSAGGHLTATLATQHAEATYKAVDAADKLSTRPFAAGLVYPVITMEKPWTHEQSRGLLLGDNPSDSEVARRS